jgi:RNA polymerase sigma-70 factor (ECF subfamily)
MDSSTANEFLQLLLKNQRCIYAFILGMVPDREEIEDLFQETVLIMWSKFDSYQRGTSFSSWGVTIAKYHIFSARKHRSKYMRHFSPAVQALLQARADHYIQYLDDRVHALRNCLKKLDKQDYELIKMRYEEEVPIQSIAERMGRSMQSIYKKITRIHEALVRCVQRTMKMEGLA